MESFEIKSVASLVDSTPSRKSREFTPSPPIRTLPLAPVFRSRKLTDFSISKILGLENVNETHKEETKCTGKWNF